MGDRQPLLSGLIEVGHSVRPRPAVWPRRMTMRPSVSRQPSCNCARSPGTAPRPKAFHDPPDERVVKAHGEKSGNPSRPVSASRTLGATDVPAIQCRPSRIDGMNRNGVRQAAQVLRTQVTSLGAHDHLAQVSTWPASCTPVAGSNAAGRRSPYNQPRPYGT
jgi:hypothetical protein